MAAGMKKVKPVEPVISETQDNPYMDAITQAEASRGSDKPVTAAVPVSEGPDPWGYKPAQNYTTGLSNMVWNPDVRGMDFQEDSLPSGTRSYERSSYSASSGGNGNPYAAAIDAFDYGPAPAWDGTEYERRRDAALQRAENMQFAFDPDTDPSWQAYQKQYRREGQRATADALGQAAAMTGGVPSSYAVTAASQAGDYYAAQLSDRLPQIYQDAYNRYLQEYQRQLGIADTYAGYGQTEYNRYLDRLGQYNTDRNFAYGTYRDAIGDQRYADETAYARQRAAEEWEYQQARDAIGDQRYQTEWERKIADADLDNALAVAKYLGYVPEQYAEILGVPAGTQYYTLANKTTGGSGGGRSSGSGGTGDWSKLTAAKLRDALAEFYGGRILTKQQWYEAIGKDDRITDAWLRKNGFVQEQDIRNAESTGEAMGIVSAMGDYMDYLRAAEGNGATGGKTGGSSTGFIHNDAEHTAMSDGFRRVWPTLRNDFDAGMSRKELLQKIMRYRDNGTLTDDDVNVIIDQLGLDRGGFGR